MLHFGYCNELAILNVHIYLARPARRLNAFQSTELRRTFGQLLSVACIETMATCNSVYVGGRLQRNDATPFGVGTGLFEIGLHYADVAIGKSECDFGHGNRCVESRLSGIYTTGTNLYIDGCHNILCKIIFFCADVVLCKGSR